MEFVNNLGKRLDSVLENKTNTLIISLILVLYAGLAAPALPNSVVKFFDTTLGKVIFLFLIGFMASRNVQVALMIAVAYVVTLHIANKRATEEYINFLRNERFENYYELFKDDPLDVQKNRALIVPKLCEWVKDANTAMDELKKIMTGDKLKKEHAELTVSGFFALTQLSDDHKLDKFVDKVKSQVEWQELKEKTTPPETESVPEEEEPDLITTFINVTLKDEKLSKLCDIKVESFENYSGENEEFEGPSVNGNEDYIGFEHFEGGDDEEDFEGDIPTDGPTENFHEDMEQFNNFSVVPADNLNGNSAKMYAPVKFE